MNISIHFKSILFLTSTACSTLIFAAAEKKAYEESSAANEAAEDADFQRGSMATVLAECMTKQGELSPWEKEIKRLGKKYFGQFKSKKKDDLAKKIYANIDKIPQKAAQEIYKLAFMPKEQIDDFNNKK